MNLPHRPTSLPHRTTRALARVVLPSLLLGVVFSGERGVAGQERLHPGVAPGSDSAVTAWQAPARADGRIREILTERWGVPSESLLLAWGEPRGGVTPAENARIELLGSGRDGRFVVSFREDDGRTEALSLLLRVGVSLAQPVATRTLERGETLGLDDLHWEDRVCWGPPENSEILPQAGWVAQRRVEAGELLTTPALRPPLLVVSGKAVRIIWVRGSVEITLLGTAVRSGSRGEQVLVRTQTGQRLAGVVEGPGLVRIEGPNSESGR